MDASYVFKVMMSRQQTQAEKFSSLFQNILRCKAGRMNIHGPRISMGQTLEIDFKDPGYNDMGWMACYFCSVQY